MNKTTLNKLPGITIGEKRWLCCSYCGRTPAFSYPPGQYGGLAHAPGIGICDGIWLELLTYESALQRSATIIAERTVPSFAATMVSTNIPRE